MDSADLSCTNTKGYFGVLAFGIIYICMCVYHIFVHTYIDVKTTNIICIHLYIYNLIVAVFDSLY